MKSGSLRAALIAPFVALTFAGTLSAAPPAAAEEPPIQQARRGGCGDTLDPEVNGVRGHWTLDCSGGQITVDGDVEDIQYDGNCVGARGEFASGETERTGTCEGYGSRAYFRWTHPGSIADVYIYEYED